MGEHLANRSAISFVDSFRAVTAETLRAVAERWGIPPDFAGFTSVIVSADPAPDDDVQPDFVRGPA